MVIMLFLDGGAANLIEMYPNDFTSSLVDEFRTLLNSKSLFIEAEASSYVPPLSLFSKFVLGHRPNFVSETVQKQTLHLLTCSWLQKMKEHIWMVIVAQLS